MRIRSFIIAYALVLAILLFADRRPGSTQQDHYSHVIDLTSSGTDDLTNDLTNRRNAPGPNTAAQQGPAASGTRIIAPGDLIPGTWSAGQIPPERLVAPLVVMSPKVATEANSQISLDDIADWESQHGVIPQGAVIAIRGVPASDRSSRDRSPKPFPIAPDAAEFLIDARYSIGFAVEMPVNLTSNRTLARQFALHGSYVVEGTAPFGSLPATGSLIIIAPARNNKSGNAPVRVLAMVR